ncbi:MAG TPA: cytochrome c biogenesis protein CcsA [bacterium]|jgi:cytochrome c-type biogenesis protein CcsB|nr:cytochrome c biogenesis protein CcsA [bacterium]
MFNKFMCLIMLIFAAPVYAQQFDFKTISLIPIQDGGRVKPFDTFARESVRFITGHEKFEDKGSVDVVFDWLTHPAEWNDKNFILIENLDLKSLLSVEKDQKRISPQFLLKNDGFIAYAKMNYAKQQKKITLNAMEKESLSVFGRLEKFEDIESGRLLTLIPIPDEKTEKWISIEDLQSSYRKNAQAMPDPIKDVLISFAGLLKAYDGHNTADFSTESQNLSMVLNQLAGKESVDAGKMALEVQFNAVKPFQWTWIIQLSAFVLMGLSIIFGSRMLYKPGFGLFLAGILMSIYGFTMRCIIAGRPPVSNMYESLIWVTFGMTFFALIFELIYKNKQFAMAGSILAVVGFVLADNVPTILDSSIQPIEPVLRSNFWLTIHVLTITLSYAAFLLSMGIGHVCLWTLWKHPRNKEKLQNQIKLLYRVVQVGIVLLAAGTILGGVWASYSWGRFWGWDPKETWALIALLGYVAILHGRLSGWLKEAGFIIGVVLAFLGVLMAWYGVNFILGAGLHSYGFSKGGLPYVISFVVIELIIVTVVGLKATAKK